MGTIVPAYLAGVPRSYRHIELTPDRFLLLALAGIVAVLLLTWLKLRDRRHLRRERGLEEAVCQRTEELQRGRSRETARNSVLEMLVANRSLGLVLDTVARMIRDEIPAAGCAILLHHDSRSHLAASAGVPVDWIEALNAPHAIPFEVRRRPGVFESQSTDPAWRIFVGGVQSPPPGWIHARPVGNSDLPSGAVLVFAEDPSPFTAEVLDHAVRLAQLAIDHCRLYEDLQFQARHDSLTGLPNRSLYEERLSRALREALDLKQRLAVLYVDLDKFKLINDSTSHRIGDLFLCEIAARMRSVVRSGDTVARIGGDEFNILLHNISNEGEAETIAERIRNAVRQAVVIEGRTLAVSASVGIAFFPDDGTNAEDLQRDADAAMYCAKGMGRDRVQVFGARNESLDRVRMEHDLRAALRDRLFAVHYQPKVSAGGLFGGLEALLRLEHPVHGQIPPARFIPMAEETGLIVPLGAWVLDEVCRQIAEWRASGLGTIPVAVNVSPVQISRPEFAQQVEEALARHSVSPFSLDLELTESQLIGSGEESQQQMRRLRAIGVTFSLDDFGTGYSSLSYLHRLKVDAIKLDRSFVQSIDTDEAARRLVQAMIGVAQGLGLNVIAEGVETEAQRAVLIAAGCPMMQGYLFSRPRPPAELREYLASVASAPDDLARIGRVLGHAASSEEQLQTV